MIFMKKKIKYILIVLILNFNLAFSKNINLIRDAEIENFIYDLSLPILKSANLEKKNINFYIDQQSFINAFVTFGNNIFVTTELLSKVKNVDQIAGVIAHEIGHLKGGHLNKRLNQGENSLLNSVLSGILAAGAIAAGSSEAGGAILMGSEHIKRQNLLSFSRKQESYADQAAIKYLKSSNYSVKGMVDLFTLLAQNERFSNINTYSLTHPLSKERKKIIKLHLYENEVLQTHKLLNQRLKLIQAKLIGFTIDTDKISKYFPENKLSKESCYANSIKNYRLGKITKSLDFINACINLDNKNPYFHELKGQILYENAQTYKSINSFKNAQMLKNDEKFFNLALAKAYYSSGKKANYMKSIQLLKKYVEEDKFPVEAWHYMALSYGKLKNFSFSALALAEKFLLLNDLKNAKQQIKKIEKLNDKNPEVISLVNDIKNIITRREKK